MIVFFPVHKTTKINIKKKDEIVSIVVLETGHSHAVLAS